MRFIEPAEIEAIKAAGNYVTLILANDSLVMRGSLASIEARLGEQGLLRISRSTMANVKQIKELRRCVYGGYGIITKSGKELKMSRGYAKKLKQLSWPA